MESPALIYVCISSFVGVFLLLSLLAVIMKAIIAVFPMKESRTDSALIAAIASTYNKIYPGTKITKIEELK
ncbi:MAG: hypothetical protein GF307_05080 [candidate division Zixibacteria bacterium]|nr:hypothetical protein [candidate division Zixibacteria bacterium]